MERAGRQRSDFQLSVSGLRGDRRTTTELAAGAVGARKQIAFYGSTPAYRKVLELHGWGDLHTELHRLQPSGRVGYHGHAHRRRNPRRVRGRRPPSTRWPTQIRERCAGVIDRVARRFPVLSARGQPSAPCSHELRGQPAEESPLTAPTMDEAAKVFADPLAYADEAKLHAALTHLRAHTPVAWVDVPVVPAVLGHHQARRHHGDRAGQHAVHQLTAAGADDRRGRRAAGRASASTP